MDQKRQQNIAESTTARDSFSWQFLRADRAIIDARLGINSLFETMLRGSVVKGLNARTLTRRVCSVLIAFNFAKSRRRAQAG